MSEKEKWMKEIIKSYEKDGYFLKSVKNEKKLILTFEKTGKEKEVVLTWDDHLYKKLKPSFSDSPLLHADLFQIPGTKLNMYGILFQLEDKRYKFTIRQSKEGIRFLALVDNKKQKRFEEINDALLSDTLRDNLMQKQTCFFEAYQNLPSIRLRNLFQKK